MPFYFIQNFPLGGWKDTSSLRNVLEMLWKAFGLKGAQQPDPLETVWVEALISQAHRHYRLAFLGVGGVPLLQDWKQHMLGSLHNSRSPVLHSKSALPTGVGTKGEETFPPVIREGLITEGLALPCCGQTAGCLTATAGGAPRAWRRQASEMCVHIPQVGGHWPGLATVPKGAAGKKVSFLQL